MLEVTISLLSRDLRTAMRRWGDLVTPLMFFGLVGVLFPLALSPEPRMLRTIAPAVLWVAALLSTLLSLNALYRSDVEDGTMEQLVLSQTPLALAMFAKTAAHWALTGIPLVVAAPLFGVAYNLSATAIATLCLTLLIGSPTLCLLGSIGAALTAGVRQTGGLLALIVLPLMLPVLIFGARATDLAANGADPAGPVFLLGAMLALSASLAPFGAAAAMRITVD
jgi:heme exporter protein B